MSVLTEITRINTAVTDQADLIAQIQTALEGKAAAVGWSETVSGTTLIITTGVN